MKKSNFNYLLTLVIISFLGCAKDGETGPDGPPGPAGPQGLTGANGNSGAAGNANVHSKTFNLTSSDWTQSGAFTYLATMPDSDITQAIVDSGIVNVYYFEPSASAWTPLPYTQVLHNSNDFLTWSYSYITNQINLKVEDFATTPLNPGNTDFRVITVSSFGRIANPHLNWNSYEEVKATFNLSD
jgi:hypothetical protein